MTLFIRIKKAEILLLILLIAVTSFLRFAQLGYSDYYDDETKTIYWDKTQTAVNFFLEQRKGPVQFLTVWVVEKVLGIDELTIRIPFAVTSVLAVLILYFLVKRWYDYKVAFVTALLVSLGGFYIAFGRTAQYQSVLLMSGLLAILLADTYTRNKKYIYLILSAFSISMALLSHYDGIFYLIPIFLLLMKDKKALLTYVIISLSLVSIFYVPYFLKGYFHQNTLKYLASRFEPGISDSSLFTYWVYNPTYLWFLPLGISFLTLVFKRDKYLNYIFLWMLIPLILFELIVCNPGTHIQNYILPILMTAGIGMGKFLSGPHKNMYKIGILVVITVFLTSLFFVQAKTFIPALSDGYPWNSPKIAKAPYKVFFYGFPYKRGWSEIANYINNNGGAYTFNTTDNIDVARYYLRGIPRYVRLPHYFIHVYDNQKFKDLEDELVFEKVSDSGNSVEYLRYSEHIGVNTITKLYELKKSIYVNDEPTALIYKRISD